MYCDQCGEFWSDDRPPRFCDRCGNELTYGLPTFTDIIKPLHLHFKRPDGTILTIRDPLNSPLPMNQVQMTGDTDSKPWDLDTPYRIWWLFYDDLDIPDNYSDLILRISFTTPPNRPTNHGHFTIVFFCEGSLDKWVCYPDDQGKRRLIHHYDPDNPKLKYGIFVDWDLDLKGPCPFDPD
jgi:hypothetical protein